MRPGTEERIAVYCERADRGITLTEGPRADEGYWEQEHGIDSIPIRPPKTQRTYTQRTSMDTSQPASEISTGALIDALTNPETLEKVRAEITLLESKIEKLKKLEAAITRPAATTRVGVKMKERPDVVQKIVKHVEKHGPAKPGEIAAATGLNCTHIGRQVVASPRLAKRPDGRIHIVK